MNANFEQAIPGLYELRAKERENRSRAFEGLTHTLCGVEVCQLTPRHRLRLQLLRNAFTSPTTMPLDGDVFVFLWVLSPASPWGNLASAWLQWRLRRHVAKLNRDAAIREIKLYLLAQLQDMPEGGDGDGKDQSPWVHWMAADATFYLSVHGGFSFDEYLRTPYLVLQQLYRAWKCNHPDYVREDDGSVRAVEPDFTNASDKHLRQYIVATRDLVAARIRNQRERRN